MERIDLNAIGKIARVKQSWCPQRDSKWFATALTVYGASRFGDLCKLPE
jgi:hypothetical protein